MGKKKVLELFPKNLIHLGHFPQNLIHLGHLIPVYCIRTIRHATIVRGITACLLISFNSGSAALGAVVRYVGDGGMHC